MATSTYESRLGAFDIRQIELTIRGLMHNKPTREMHKLATNGTQEDIESHEYPLTLYACMEVDEYGCIPFWYACLENNREAAKVLSHTTTFRTGDQAVVDAPAFMSMPEVSIMYALALIGNVAGMAIAHDCGASFKLDTLFEKKLWRATLTKAMLYYDQMVVLALLDVCPPKYPREGLDDETTPTDDSDVKLVTGRGRGEGINPIIAALRFAEDFEHKYDDEVILKLIDVGAPVVANVKFTGNTLTYGGFSIFRNGLEKHYHMCSAYAMALGMIEVSNRLFRLESQTLFSITNGMTVGRVITDADFDWSIHFTDVDRADATSASSAHDSHDVHGQPPEHYEVEHYFDEHQSDQTYPSDDVGDDDEAVAMDELRHDEEEEEEEEYPTSPGNYTEYDATDPYISADSDESHYHHSDRNKGTQGNAIVIESDSDSDSDQQ